MRRTISLFICIILYTLHIMKDWTLYHTLKEFELQSTFAIPCVEHELCEHLSKFRYTHQTPLLNSILLLARRCGHLVYPHCDFCHTLNTRQCNDLVSWLFKRWLRDLFFVFACLMIAGNQPHSWQTKIIFDAIR